MAERTRRSRASGGTSRRSARSSEPEGRLSRDYGDEEYREPGEGYDGEEPTKGLYTCELIRVGDHTSQDGNESVKWLFRLADGSVNKNGDDVSGWMDSQYTTENTAWKEQQMLVALGVIKPGGKVNLSYDAIVKKAKPCTVRVGVERVIDEEGEGTWRGRMQAFLPLRDATAAKRGTTKRNRDDEGAEGAEDVFEGDEDDDEEEEAPPARSRRSTSRSRRTAEPEPEPDEDEEDEDESEDEEEDYDPDALAAELEELSLAALKKRAKEEFGVTIKSGMKADDIIDAVIETIGDEEDSEEEDEEEEEEPPPSPKRSARHASAKGGAGRTTTRKRGSSTEPPF